MATKVNQETQRTNELYSERTSNVYPLDLLIEEFDQWSNPRRLRAGNTLWTKAEPCEDAA